MSCIFCDIISGQISSDKLYEDELVIAFKDLHPIAPTHILVIPKIHLESLNNISLENKELLGHILCVIQKLAQDFDLHHKGYRVVNNIGKYGGQSISHIHFHLIGGRQLSWPPG